MPARIANAATHSIALTGSASGNLTNSGSRTVGGLENLSGQTGNTFTMTETIIIIETVTTGLSSPPVPGLTDGLETSAGTYIKVTDISIPSSYNGESLSHSLSTTSAINPSSFTLAPDIKISVIAGAFVGSVGVGTQTTTATITGPVKELDDWVTQWNPVTTIPKFDGTDYATTRSAGYNKDIGPFLVQFKLEYGTLAFSDAPSPIATQELTYGIKIINNSDNDRDVYLAAYDTAYGSLSKVPEVSERAS